MGKAYPMMKSYVAYLQSKSDKHILSHGLGDWFDLGPERPGASQLTPISLTATSIYYYDLKLLSRMADIMDKKEDAARYTKLAEEVRIAFNNKFFNPKTKIYARGSQTAYSMPLYFGMVDKEHIKDVEQNLAQSIIANNKALTAGDVGYRYLLRALEQSGNSQLIYEMNSRNDVPGYGYQLATATNWQKEQRR
jgi:glycogen debranching enzyme